MTQCSSSEWPDAARLDLGTVSRIGIHPSGAFAVDEIRIATSYAVLP
jgi:hypothetical protein